MHFMEWSVGAECWIGVLELSRVRFWSGIIEHNRIGTIDCSMGPGKII